MKEKFARGQIVYFLISGRIITEAVVVSPSSWFITIRFTKNSGECIIRLPNNRIFTTEEEARKHIHPVLPPMRPASRKEDTDFVCSRRWELWE